MNPILLIILSWLKDNWKNVGLGAGFLFMLLFLRQCGEIKTYKDSLGKANTGIEELTKQKQTLEGKLSASSKSKATIKYVKVENNPCPEITVDVESDGNSNAQGSGSQNQSISETVKPTNLVCNSPLWGFTGGLGREIVGGSANDCFVGVNYGDFCLEFGVNTDIQGRVGLSYTYWLK